MYAFNIGQRWLMASDPCNNNRTSMTRQCMINNRKLFNLFCSFIIFASFSVTFTEAIKQSVWPTHYTAAHHELHETIQSTTHKHLEDFEIVTPSLVNNEYQHLSHSVRYKRINRMRRDVIDDVIDTEDLGLRYAISGFGQRFNLDLKANHQLLAPTFSVKRVRRNVEEILEKSESMGCHYHGRVTSHGNGMVAMSTCDGLTGLIQTEEDDFIVEPVASHVSHSFASPLHPHLIYKRRHLEKGNHRLHYCGKSRRYPVSIPTSGLPQTLKVLSSGAIELEELSSSSPTRRKRSVSFGQHTISIGRNDVNDGVITNEQQRRPARKNVETLVVADRDMIRNHERDHRDVTTYILTVMNMVSGLFSDRTLDGQVNIVLVGVMLMEDNEGLHLDHKAGRSLASFCTWQSNLNQSGGKRPDHSVLLTGIDICANKNSPCETLGLAQVGGMCSVRDSCTINEDMGLGLAFTVAHETGHSFGMQHDGLSNDCRKRDGHIMSPTLSGLNGVFTWSACSRRALSDFLSEANSVCLDDHPVPLSSLNFPNQLPGEIYGSESQCKWQFGTEAHLCGYRYKRKQASICKTLWCQREGSSSCETKYMPAAEGTPCGNDMWCRRGACVPYGSSGPQSIDGGWGEYEPWSSCTRSCGGGVQYRERRCDQPAPQYGGRHCVGEEKIYQLCNTRTCPASQISFRAQQCGEFNNQPYRRQYYNWVPFTKYSSFGRDQCELLCKAEGYGFFDMLARQVIDGTPCDETSLNVCIQGKCKHVGCDHVLGSNATYDICGVCKGDNSTCETVTGTYTENVLESSGYYEVVRIPRGARNVRVWEERCCMHSYIAAKSAVDNGRYFLNGKWKIDLYGVIRFAGSEWIYERKSFKTESLSTTGPLTDDVIIEVLLIAQNPGISYSYNIQIIDNYLPGLQQIPTISSRNLPIRRWHIRQSDCSKSCGGGTKLSNVVCVGDNIMTSLNEDECDSLTRPVAKTTECNTQHCPGRWVTSQWATCSRTCGGGLQTRQVTCKRVTIAGDVFARESNCEVKLKPQRSQTCHQQACPAQWQAGSWSKCSRRCGRGSRSRRVRCRSGHRIVRKSVCDRNTKPRSREPCLIAHCQRKYQWFITAWRQCPATCGSAIQRREVKCSYKKPNGRYQPVATRRCKGARKPIVSLEKACSLPPCPAQDSRRPSAEGGTYNLHYGGKSRTPSRHNARWIAGTWQKCSVSCGGGVQTRAVKCLQAGQPSNTCTHHRKPLRQRACNTYRCEPTGSQEKPSACTDQFSWCFLVPQHGQCNHSSYSVQCCKACSIVR